MSAEDDSTAECDVLIHELALLGQMRASLDGPAGNQMMVEAVTGLIQERRADLERARRARQ